MTKHIKYPYEPVSIKNYEQDKIKAVKKHLNTNTKLNKLLKEKKDIEQILLKNKDITGFQIETFKNYQENKLKNINMEIENLNHVLK